MRLLHEIAIFQTVKSKVIISLFETVRLSVSISLRNFYNQLNSILKKMAELLPLEVYMYLLNCPSRGWTLQAQLIKMLQQSWMAMFLCHIASEQKDKIDCFDLAMHQMQWLFCIFAFGILEYAHVTTNRPAHANSDRVCTASVWVLFKFRCARKIPDNF